MRVLLFLAIFGVVAAGTTLAEDNPAASAFESAAGELGLRLFGLILWAAAVTSVIGASYTSVSFLTTSRTSERTRNLLTVAFIAICAVVFVVIEQTPVRLLVFAGAFNGLILPIGFTIILWVALRRRDLLGGYRYPVWLLVIGVLAWALTLYLGYSALEGLEDL
jgi:Mn2+/Fe2+ NRAMP family transporter